ncbi:PAS domain-containing protein [Cytophagaceae bacterium ABcell3]|nr:PAS domain-containing protein [Cytophagaceae bacterium ABcell3]
MVDLDDKQWLEHIYRNTPVAIGVYLGENHVIRLANSAMCAVWDRSEAEILGKPLFDALSEVRGQGFEGILADVYNTGKAFSGNELPAVLKRNGKLETAYFNILYTPFYDKDGQVCGITQSATEVTELVLSKQQLERDQDLLQSALESGKVGTWYMDFVNDTVIRSLEHDMAFGYDSPLASWNVDMFVEHVLPEDRELAMKYYEESLKTGNADYELRVRWPDQSVHWIKVKGKAHYNLVGDAISMSGIILDITDQKTALEKEKLLSAELAAREEAKKQAQVLHDLYMEIPAGIAVMRGPNFVIELVNPEYQKLFPGKSLVGKSLLEAVPELTGQEVSDILKNVYETGKTYSCKEVAIDFYKEDGELETRYFNAIYKALYNSEGEVDGVLSFGYEITSEIKGRKLVERGEESLRIALEAGNMGTWHLDLINDTSERSLQHDQIFGYKELLPSWGYEIFMSHILPEDKAQVAEKFQIAAEVGSLEFEARILRADNEVRWITAKGKAFYQNEIPVRMAGIVMDITDRKVAEEKLKRLTEDLEARNVELQIANQERQKSFEELVHTNEKLTRINSDLDNFIYTASHDLKAPISNLEGLLSTVLSETEVSDELNPVYQMMFESIERFKETLKDLTDISHVHKGYDDPPQEVSVQHMLDEVLEDIKVMTVNSKAEIRTNFKVPNIKFSKKNLRSIIYNLVTNALKYSSPKRKPLVEIGTERNGDFVLLKVKDNGLGMDEKHKRKIFSMFKRLHDHVEGSGVGLFIVKRMIDNVGGEIIVESEVDKGSEFKIYFPLV